MLWLHKSKDVLVFAPPPFQSVLSSQWLIPPPTQSPLLARWTLQKWAVGRVEDSSFSPPPPIPRVIVCAEVSSLDQVFMTLGQFSADSPEAAMPAGHR